MYMRSVNSARAAESGVIADLWRNTLSQIPSVFGRLVYLSSLRNQNTGRYEHHGLALVFGEEDANKALRKSHAQVFAEWLSFNIEQQKADVNLYVSALFEDKKTVLDTWVRLAPYVNVLPGSARAVEKKLYLADFRAILQLLTNEYGVSVPDRDA